MIKHYTSRPLPYYAAYLQGGDYVVNIEVDKRATQPDEEAGFIKNIWIKYQEYEWEINLERLKVEFKNGSEKFFSQHDCWDERGKKKWYPCKYEIDLPDATFKMAHKQRLLNIHPKSHFFKNNPNIKNYYGAVVSQEQLRYLKELKEILI